MPIFSSLLVIPGLVTVLILFPVTKERISTVMRRWKSALYEILGVYLIYEDGTLIASKTSLEDKSVDDDVFGATLDAIQTFMRTSFPALLGKWLRRIEHGDVNILVERGKRCYLALIIRGEDTDTLWIKMKEAVERFEKSNDQRLLDWTGIPDDLDMVSETLEDLFTDRAVFA
jgi:predicted regulator of Ras-like GTPase activity (Roadblock/LC7/MglB family)